MVTNNKNFSYYFYILSTPICQMRHTLEEDYSIISLGDCCSLGYLCIIADHLTAYNEIADKIAVVPKFFRISDFRLD